MAAAVYSAITGCALNGCVALTGELGLGGEVLPVGGVPQKIAAALQAGAEKILIPRGNYEKAFDAMKQVTCIDDLDGALDQLVCGMEEKNVSGAPVHTMQTAMLTAKSRDR